MPDDTEVEDRKQDAEAGEGEPVVVDLDDPSTLPTLTDMSGTLDTSGTGGAAHNNMDAVNASFAVAKAQDLRSAQKGLDADDDSVPASMVVLPPGVDAESAKEGLDAAEDDATAYAEKVLKADYVPGSEEPEEEEEGVAARRAEGDEEEEEPVQAPAVTDVVGTFDTTGTDNSGALDVMSNSPAVVAEREAQAEAAGESDEEDDVKDEDAEKDDEDEVSPWSSDTLEDPRAFTEEPMPTDVTGTLDTSGTGSTGVLDANSVSAVALAEDAEEAGVEPDELAAERAAGEAEEDDGDAEDGDTERGKAETTTDDDGDEEPSPPAKSANKPEWVDYVVANYDISREDAEALTKEELVDTYGG